MNNDHDILSWKEATQLLNVPRRTLELWVEKRRVPHIKYPKAIMFSKRDLLAFIEKCKRAAQPGSLIVRRPYHRKTPHHEPTLIK
jgi:excisionase family DNA binding protein